MFKQKVIDYACSPSFKFRIKFFLFLELFWQSLWSYNSLLMLNEVFLKVFLYSRLHIFTLRRINANHIKVWYLNLWLPWLIRSKNFRLFESLYGRSSDLHRHALISELCVIKLLFHFCIIILYLSLSFYNKPQKY